MPGETTTQVGSPYKIGDVVMAIITDQITLSQQVNSLAGEVWFDLPDILRDHVGDPFYINATNANDATKKFIKDAGIKEYPAIVFALLRPDGKYEIKATLVGNVDYRAIRATYIRVLKNIYGEGNNVYADYDDQGWFELQEYAGDRFSIPPEVTKAIKKAFWGILGLYSTTKVFSTKSNNGKLFWGSVTAFSGYQFIKKT